MIAAGVCLALIVALAGCAPSAPAEVVDLIELDVDPPAAMEPALPQDSGAVEFATAEVLADYIALTGDQIDVAELLASEREATTGLRRALAEGSEPPGEASPRPGSSGAFASAPHVETVLATTGIEPGGAAESLIVGSLSNGVLLPLLYDSWWVQEMKIGDSNVRDGRSTTGRTTSDGEAQITRTGANELSLAFDHSSTTADGVRVVNRLVVEGTVCPSDDGEFDFTTRLNREVSGGGGATVRQELTVRITGRLGENGYPELMNVDGIQGTRHAPTSGQPVYVETRQRLENADIMNVGTLSNAPVELIRSSSRATDADVRRLASAASARIATLAWGAVMGVQLGMWNKGCVKVEASAPKTVAPRSGVEFPVTVRSRLSGEEFASGVESTLTGSESVDPASFTSRRNVTFVAGAAGTSGTILLKAASRRGTAETTVTIATTGRAYFAQGTNGDVTAIGVICDLAQPFELSGSGTVTKFSPQNASGGTFSYRDDGTYGEGLIELAASGSYSVALAADGASGTITTEGTGTTGFDTPLGRQEFEFPANLTFSLTELDDGTPDECAG